MRALITGGSGFVGTHLVAHLRTMGDDVVVTDRATDGCDILDGDALRARFTEVRPDVVYHLAGAADVGGSWGSPVATFRANAEGTLRVLLAARDAGVERVLSVGSADMYGRVTQEDLPITEETRLQPVSPYAASKIAADQVALQAHLGFGQFVVRARPFNHLGPGQSDRFVAPALASRMAAAERDGRTEIPVGNLSPRRDFTDVRDVVRAYRLLMVHGESGGVYNVCSGTAVSVQELAEHLLSLVSGELRLVPDPDLQRPVDIPVLLGDNSRLRAATGWSPELPLETTLKDLLDDYRARGA